MLRRLNPTDGSRWAHGAWSACSALIGAAQPPSSALGALSAAVCTSSYPIALGSVAASLPCSRGDCLQAAPSRSFQTLALRHDAYRRAPRTYVQLLQHISRATKFAALEQLVAGYGDKFDGVHAAAALARLPKLVRQPASGGWSAPLEPGFSARGAALVDQLQAIAGQFTNRLFARQIANSLWALSATPQLHAPSTRAFLRTLTRELAAEEYQKLFQGGRPGDVAQLAVSLAHLGWRHDNLLQALRRYAQRHAAQFEAKQAAMTAWAFARLRYSSPQLFDALAASVQEQKWYLRPRSLAALAWAYAAAGHSHPQLWAVISEVARESIADFSPHSLSVLAWSAGTARIADPALFVALSERSLVVLESFDGCSLGLLLQGFAKAGQRCPELLAAVAGGIAAEPEVAAKPGEIAKIVAAFASFGYSTEESQMMLQKLSAAATKVASSFIPRDTARLLAGLGRLHTGDPALLAALADVVARDAPRYRVAHLHSVLATYAHFNHRHEAMAAASLAKLSAVAPSLKAEEAPAAIEMLFYLTKLQAQHMAGPAEAVAEAVLRHADSLKLRPLASLLGSLTAGGGRIEPQLLQVALAKLPNDASSVSPLVAEALLAAIKASAGGEEHREVATQLEATLTARSKPQPVS